MLSNIKFAFNQRTTHTTVSNDTSSRSHAVCQIVIRNESQKIIGKLIVCDLAGSERAQDTQSNKRQRRLEGAEINKSLLALKECIRAMNNGSGHIPFRASKLTLALRDSFVGKKFKNRVVMYACICPGSSSADHSLNTIRYADRLKGKKMPQKYNYNKNDQKMIKNQVKKQGLPFDNKKRIKRGTSKKKLTKKKSMPKKTPVIKEKPSINKATPQVHKNKQPVPNKQPPLPINKDQHKHNLHEDLNFMKETLKEERESLNESENDKILPSDDFVNFHEKVSDIIDLHDEMLALHLNIIREDAQLLTRESEIISRAQSDADDYDIDNYVDKIEEIVKKKLFLYKQLSSKIKNFKKALKEEEEISMKVRDTFYY